MMAGRLLGILLSLPLTAQAEFSQQALDWLNDDSEQPDARQVNEGQLTFLAPISDRRVLHSTSELFISPASLDNGWVELRQCYRQLDPVGRTAVVYSYRQLRNLAVTHTEHIGSAHVDQQTVNLEDVGEEAELCIRAEVANLKSLGGGRYRISTGPYHRKFLDGYYPFRISLQIHYPPQLLRVKRISPQAQPGFEPRIQDNRLDIDTWFEGRLLIDIDLQTRRQ